MARLRVLCVGKTQPGFIQQGVEHYLGRVRTLHALDWEELRAAGHSGRTPAQALQREGEALLKRLPPGERVVLLDEAGQRLTSPGLAGWLGRCEEEGLPVTLVIGGAFGVSPGIQERAQQRLSLSSLTLPHQLVRIVLLEQLYRGFSILAGQPYHHGTPD